MSDDVSDVLTDSPAALMLGRPAGFHRLEYVLAFVYAHEMVSDHSVLSSTLPLTAITLVQAKVQTKKTQFFSISFSKAHFQLWKRSLPHDDFLPLFSLCEIDLLHLLKQFLISDDPFALQNSPLI